MIFFHFRRFIKTIFLIKSYKLIITYKVITNNGTNMNTFKNILMIWKRLIFINCLWFEFWVQWKQIGLPRWYNVKCCVVWTFKVYFSLYDNRCLLENKLKHWIIYIIWCTCVRVYSFCLDRTMQQVWFKCRRCTWTLKMHKATRGGGDGIASYYFIYCTTETRRRWYIVVPPSQSCASVCILQRTV